MVTSAISSSRLCRHFQTQKKDSHFRNCLIFRAENETRTRDPNLGKVVLYQLSYFRNMLHPLLRLLLAKVGCVTYFGARLCSTFLSYFRNMLHPLQGCNFLIASAKIGKSFLLCKYFEEKKYQFFPLVLNRVDSQVVIGGVIITLGAGLATQGGYTDSISGCATSTAGR